MGDFYDEINVLIGEISDGKIGRVETEQIIKELKNKYGDNAFPGFQFKKEPKPWTKEYFNMLRTKNITGACSEEFILHMAEVSEALTKRKKRNKCIAALIIILALIIVLLIMLRSGITVSRETVVTGRIIKIATIQYKILFI